MHERINRYIPKEISKPRPETRIPGELGEKLRESQHLIVDLDDTLIVFDTEKTVLRLAWFVLCDNDQSLDPRLYKGFANNTMQRDSFVEQIGVLSAERYGDSDYLFKAALAWTYAFRTGGERNAVTNKFFGPDLDTRSFWNRYDEFRNKNLETRGETRIAEGGIDFLNWAHGDGRSIHIISNSEKSVIERYLNQIEVSGYNGGFGNVISAVEKGKEFRKPHISSLELLLELIQDQHLQAAYIGNEEEDVLFAAHASLQLPEFSVVPVLVTRGLDYSDISMPSHCEFPGFVDLERFLAA